MIAEHPIVRLRCLLAGDFTADLPPGVRPVGAWCRDPQFFPGATGLLTADSWSGVVPGSAGLLDPPPPAPVRGLLVIGNYQATLASYQRVLDGTIGGFPTTWRVLRQLLANTPPRDVFLTNAYIGLPDLAHDRVPFPTTDEFTARCGRLLTREIELLEPRCVVCLGVPAAKMLATITERLPIWRPWPGFGKLRAAGAETVRACRIGSAKFSAVAVSHPSAVVSGVERQRQAALIEAASA
jgi:hypothetical protein